MGLALCRVARSGAAVAPLSHLSGASERPRPMEYLGGGVSGFKWGFSTTRPADGWGHISSVAGELCVSELYSLFVFFGFQNFTVGLEAMKMQNDFLQRFRGPKIILQYTGSNLIPGSELRKTAAPSRGQRQLGGEIHATSAKIFR